MRTIKFRIWDKIENKWVENFTVYQYGNVASNGVWLDSQTVEKCQFTGLLDCNGKEIYEGDIIKSKESEEVWRIDSMLPAHRDDHVTNIGYFDGKKYHARTKPAAQYHNHDDWMSWPEMYEIIGNIYENPEALSDLTTKE